MTKRFLSVILVLAMLFATSLTAFAMTPVMPGDEDEEPAVTFTISFDAASAGWNDSQWVGFHIWEPDGDPLYEYGTVSERGTNAGNGIWTYQATMESDGQYEVIFYNDQGRMTYNLTMDYDCDNDTAYCKDDTCYQAPTDSTKSAQVVYWRDQDPEWNGPEKKITPMGEVIGTANLWSRSDWVLMTDFIKNDLKRVAEVTKKSEQEIIDHIGEQLGYYAEDIEDIIRFEELFGVQWSIGNSPLPLEHDPEKDLYLKFEEGNYYPLTPNKEREIWVVFLAEHIVSEITGTVTFDTTGLSVDKARLEEAVRCDEFYDCDYTYDEGTGVLSYHVKLRSGVTLDQYNSTHGQAIDGESQRQFYFIGPLISIPFTPVKDKGIYEVTAGYQTVKDLNGSVIAENNESKGAFFMMHCLPGEYEPDVIRGDYDMDGEVTILDATRAQRIIADLDERPDEAFLFEVDADGDGELTILDATRIQRVIADLCDWDGESTDTEPFIPGDEYELPLVPPKK